MAKPNIIRVIDGVHMGLGHDGLRKLLRKQASIDLDDVQGQDLVFCINTAGDKLKVIGCKGLVLAYLKMPGGKRIMRDALRFIPNTFGSRGFDYDAACEQAITNRFPTLSRAKQGPLEVARAAKQAGL
jgi:hypothetical protein